MAQKSSARGMAQKSGDHARLTREPSRIGEQSWQLPDVASRCASTNVDAARKKIARACGVAATRQRDVKAEHTSISLLLTMKCSL
jgi:hypothetical protein